MKTFVRVALFALSGLCAAPSFAEMPAFLVLQDGGVFLERSRAIEATGAHIRQAIPPSILIVDLPKGAKPSALPGVGRFYTAAVPVADLESHGPTAVAAGLQWNKRILNSARTGGIGTLGSMRQMVAENSLSAPVNLHVNAAQGRLACAWEGVDGATYYELQASPSSLFDQAGVRTSSVKPTVDIVAPDGGDIYVRVRAVDPGDAGVEDDIYGRWSSPTRLGASPMPSALTPPAPPTPTSPADGLQTEGFTLILEWTPSDGAARVQVARDRQFSDVVFDEIASGGEYACPGPALRTGDRLYWRVQSLNGGRSAWSASRAVSIGSPHNAKIDAFVNPEAPR